MVTLNSYGQGWSRSSGPEIVPSDPPPLSVLVSDDSELARTALATFVALILDCTLRSDVVEGIFARASLMIESCVEGKRCSYDGRCGTRSGTRS